jgi:hypothetical protein
MSNCNIPSSFQIKSTLDSLYTNVSSHEERGRIGDAGDNRAAQSTNPARASPKELSNFLTPKWEYLEDGLSSFPHDYNILIGNQYCEGHCAECCRNVRLFLAQMSAEQIENQEQTCPGGRD